MKCIKKSPMVFPPAFYQSSISFRSNSRRVARGATHFRTPTAVKSRIKALEKKNMILGYRIMLDQEQLKKVHCRIFFFLENIPGEQEKFRTFMAQQPEVISITKTIGYCELECRMYVDDVKEFYGFMARIKTRFSALMKDFEPIIYYKFHKSLNYYPIK